MTLNNGPIFIQRLHCKKHFAVVLFLIKFQAFNRIHTQKVIMRCVNMGILLIKKRSYK